MALHLRFILLATILGLSLENPVDNNDKVASTTHVENEFDFVRDLSRYGYYAAPDPRSGALASMANLEAAIKKYQRFYGLQETGQMTSETLEWANKPRCGMSDFGPTDNTKRKRRWVHQGSRWADDKRELTWRILNRNNDGLHPTQVENLMRRAFKKWSDITNLDFKMIGQGTPDIAVSFQSNYHSDPYPFDGRGGTLAHAFYPHNNLGLSGDVHFDDSEYFTIGSDKGIDLYWVAVHEIGHSIGMEHSNVQEAIMFPSYTGFKGNEFDLHFDDISGIQHIYGSRTPGTVKPQTNLPAASTTQPAAVSTAQPPATTPPPPRQTCLAEFKSVFLDPLTKLTYVVNNDKMYVIGKKLGVEKGPVPVTQMFKELVNGVDAAYSKPNGNIIFFKDTRYYLYKSLAEPTLLETRSIHDKYRGLPRSVERIDAAFVWFPNGKTYLFAGSDYYRFDEYLSRVDYGYPRRVSPAWGNIPSHVDSVFIWSNDVTYFFKGTQYYRIDYNRISNRIELLGGYPKEISEPWSKCSSVNGVAGRISSSETSASANIVTLTVTMLTAAVARLM